MTSASEMKFQHYSFANFRSYCAGALEGALQELLDTTSIVPPLSEAVRQAVLSGGKRIRPIFALLVAADLGSDFESLIQPAVSLELLHAASLIHDDLPALDDDDFRRGQPSCHKVFGEASAILAGDLLISLANYNIAQSGLPEWRPALVASINRAFIDLCNGQQIDLIGTKNPKGLRALYRLKTGALFRCAAEFAAVSADVHDEVGEFLAAFGERLGLAFQLADDFTDIFGTVLSRGRPESSDLRNKKETWCSHLSREDALRELRQERDFLHSEVQELGRLIYSTSPKSSKAQIRTRNGADSPTIELPGIESIVNQVFGVFDLMKAKQANKLDQLTSR